KVREIGGDDAAAELKTVMSLPYNLRNVRECYHVAADINNDFAVGDVTVHEELAKYIIDGGQMKQFTKEDFENFINMYEQIVRANYKACDGGDVRASPVEYAGFELALNLLRGQLKNTYQSNAKQ
ncbi:MAG: hypothetical protein LBQ49_02105, partial [Rickettsiales bacterium]|nr:hypothetical protein [Rickettsiales bacterium]